MPCQSAGTRKHAGGGREQLYGDLALGHETMRAGPASARHDNNNKELQRVASSGMLHISFLFQLSALLVVNLDNVNFAGAMDPEETSSAGHRVLDC